MTPFGWLKRSDDVAVAPPSVEVHAAPSGHVTIAPGAHVQVIADGRVSLSPEAVGEIIRVAARNPDRIPQPDARVMLGGRE